jgi:hypothetical protein
VNCVLSELDIIFITISGSVYPKIYDQSICYKNTHTLWIVCKEVGYNAAHMKEIAKPVENDPEPRLSELVSELDAADLDLLKRYGWFINIPTEHTLNRVLEESSNLHHSFGQFLRKVINGDIESHDEKVNFTSTVITDIAQKHYWILSRYETANVELKQPDADAMHVELEVSLSEALEESREAFSNLAIDRLESIIDAEQLVINLLADCVREKRILMGKQALGAMKDVAKVSAGTVLGMAAWSKFIKKA